MFFRKRRNLKSMDDEMLVSHYKESQASIYVGELFERYAHLVYLVGMKYLKNPDDAEDVSMQVFEKLIHDLPKYEVRKFKPWLHTVSKNQCLIFLEKQKRQRKKQDEYEENESGLMENGQEVYLNSEAGFREMELQQLEAAIPLLNEHQRKCVELFYLQQKSYQEVSDETGYTMKQVKSYIQNGKRNLKKHLETQTSANTPMEGNQ